MTSLLAIVVILIFPGMSQARGRPPAARLTAYVTEAGNRFAFRSFEDDDGGFYLVWQRQDGKEMTLLGQHVDAAGNLSWEQPGIPLITGLAPDALWDAGADSRGGLVVAWEKDTHISGRRIGRDQKSVWPQNDERLSTRTTIRKAPVLAADGAGGAYVAWQERTAQTPNRWVLMAQHLDSNGRALWTKGGTRVSLRPSNQERPRMVFDGAAGVIIAWNDFRENASQLQAQRLDYQGIRHWGPEGVLVTAPSGNRKNTPDIAAIGRGSAVMGWQASSSAADRVFVQLVDAVGKLRWEARGVEVSVGSGHQWNPVLHGDGEGGVWVGWEDYRSERYWQVFTQRFGVTGRSVWDGDEVSLTGVIADQGRLAVTDDRQGGLLAAWVDNRLGTVGVYVQKINAKGLLELDRDGLLVGDGLVNPETPQITSLTPSQTVVCWADSPAKGRWSLYWRRIALKS